MTKKKQPAGHFERGYNKPGWVYIARNDLHREDIYKVGYTEKTPEGRVSDLNTEQRNRTSQIGFFQLIYATAVLDSQGCEQALFRKIGKLKESPKKEFVNAPLELVIGELLAIQKKDHEKISSKCVCRDCGFIITFCPLPQAKLTCPSCDAEFQCTEDGKPTQNVRHDAKPIRYFAPGVSHELRKHSPIAKSFIALKSACKNYLAGNWTDNEFIEEIDQLLEVDAEFDRLSPAPKSIKLRQPRVTKAPKSRKGWMDCPDCLTSIELATETGIASYCTECGWHSEE